MGQTQSSRHVCVTSGLPLIADMRRTGLDVGFVPIGNMRQATFIGRIERGFNFRFNHLFGARKQRRLLK